MAEVSTGLDAAARPRRSLRASLAEGGVGVSIASTLATLAIWEWYGRGVDPIFMSYPTAIVAAVPKMWAKGEILTPLLTSAQSLAVGLSLAIFFGVLLGLLMGRYRFVDRLLTVQLSALYSTPSIALIPVLILWFG